MYPLHLLEKQSPAAALGTDINRYVMLGQGALGKQKLFMWQLMVIIL